jgi:hypothetical protein
MGATSGLSINLARMGSTVAPADIDTSIGHPFESVDLTAQTAWAITSRETGPVWIHQSRWHPEAPSSSSTKRADANMLRSRAKAQYAEFLLRLKEAGDTPCTPEGSYYALMGLCLNLNFPRG